MRSSTDPLHWYDYPAFYELGFRDETKPEANFFEQAFAKYADGPVKSLLEPGCGSGRLVLEMASRGYKVTGFDLNENALRYLKLRLKRRKLQATAVVADMCAFKFPQQFDAAFNTFNTFRHLLDDKAALGHLSCVADHVRPGGIFILGMHIFPPDADPWGTERWKAKHGKTTVSYSLKVMDVQPRKRIEQLQISMKINSSAGERKLKAQFPLRTYNAPQLKKLLAQEPRWEIADVFDFWYDIDDPLELNDKIVDTVLILKRR